MEAEETKYNSFSPVRAFIVLIVTLFLWTNIGILAAFLFGRLDLNLMGIEDYILIHIPYIVMFLSLLICCNLILKTPIRILISGKTRKIRWKYLFEVALIYFLLEIILSALSLKSIHPNHNIRGFIVLLLPAIACTTMQALSEELFFRAIPARLIFHDSFPDDRVSMLPISVVSGMLFLMPHLTNSEAGAVSSKFLLYAYYFLWGFMAMLLGLSTGGFEAPLAMHAVNNLYVALFVNYADSSMQTPSLFMNVASLSPASSICYSIFTFLMVFAFSYRMGWAEKK